MAKARTLLTILLIGTLAANASAAALDVELGWGGAYRNLRWAPIFITAADSTPRTAVIELLVPHDSLQSMTIRQVVTITPMPTTFVLYAPLGGRLDETSVKLLDVRGRMLADWVNDPTYGTGPTTLITEPVNQLIGISGRSGPKSLIEAHFDHQTAVARSIEMNRLPRVARGYESLNALLLDQPDLTRMSSDQQHAIVDWVRGGGHVVCWMGEDQLPATSPLLQVLPATVGENTTVQVSPSALDEAGLPARFANMKGRILLPTPDATAVPLFGGLVHAYQRSLGLGSIVLVPFDCSTLLIHDQQRATTFWKPLLDGAVDLSRRDEASSPSFYYDPSQQHRGQAASAIMNHIGDVPGAGRFGFSWVTLVMVGLMVVVGPLDWIVLKRLGRQPWTWITTGGWIGLVTLGALYLGHILKSGDLHFRTLRMVDQVGDSTIAAVDTVAIYSPRTAEYELKTDPETWWEPLTAEQHDYGRGMRTDIDFHQDYRGNTPETMRINVWNLRFLTSDTPTSAAPFVQADVRYERRDNGAGQIIGTIKNVGGSPLKQLYLRAPAGFCLLEGARIEPGATFEVNAPLISYPVSPRPQNPWESHYQPSPVWPETLFRLAAQRSSRIDNLVRSRKPILVVYAECDSAQALAQLQPSPTAQWHVQLVRAVVPLNGVTP
jgi:hypothetical protein